MPYSALVSEVNTTTSYQWMLPSSVSNDATVNYCDYYQNMVGYVFTSFDSGIGTIILDDRKTSALSTSYMNKTTPFDAMNWDWKALANLTSAFCKNSTSNSTSDVTTNPTFVAMMAWISSKVDLEVG
jgi:hypothetical protein